MFHHFRLRDVIMVTAAAVATIACEGAVGRPGATVGTLSTAPLASLMPPTLPAQLRSPDVASGSTRQVPDSIDATGSSDASAALQRFLDQVPNGSTIVFPEGATYRMDRGLHLWSRRDLVFEGNGATLVANGSGGRVEDSIFALMNGNERIVIRGFTLEGNNPDSGTADAWHRKTQFLMGVLIWASSDVEISDMTMTRFYGDCVYVGTSVTRAWSERITFRDSTCTGAGRHGVGIVAGRDLTIERVHFDDIGMFIVDIEPDDSDQGASKVMVRANTIGEYGQTDDFGVHMFAACGAEGSTVTDVSIIGNDVSGNPKSGWEGKTLGLNIAVCGNLGPRSRFTVRDNTSRLMFDAEWHSPMNFREVDGVIVTGNRQPISDGGAIATFRGSTNVFEAANDTAP